MDETSLPPAQRAQLLVAAMTLIQKSSSFTARHEQHS